MSRIPTREEAWTLLNEYNREPFHLFHAQVVEGVMRWFSEESGEDPDFWGVVGLLHDLDFELFPEEHCVKEQEILRAHDIDERIVHAVASHGYLCSEADAVPEHPMEKTLYAVDELTGLIGAVARMRPSGNVSDLELKSVMKKYKTLNFAAGCSREVIQRGAEMMGISLEELIHKTILAMRTVPGC